MELIVFSSIRTRLVTLIVALMVPAAAMTACGSASVSTATPEPAPEPEPEPVAEAPAPVDSDGDGIPDEEDMCPDRAGVANADDPQRHGCPERRRNARARIERDRVVITEKIMFATNSAEIDQASASLLDEIAETIAEAGRRIGLIEIAGHADKRGDAKRNLQLTEQRADAVVQALVQRGVDAEKLRAKGYGSYCPIDPKNNEANRRVEFVILKMGRRATDAETGCEAAAAAGVATEPVPE